MASWLKAAEDLFEVVDRRAKLVVSELADEQSDSKSPGVASSGQGSQGNRSKSKSKAQKGQAVPSPVSSDTAKESGGIQEAPVNVTSPSNKFDSTKVQKGQSISSPIINDITKEQVGTPAEPLEVTTLSDNVDLNLVAENDGSASMSTSQADKEQQPTEAMPPLSGIPSPEEITNDVNKPEMDNVEVLVNDNNAEPSTIPSPISTDGQLSKENASDIHDGPSSPSNKGIEGPSENQSTDTGLTREPGNLDANFKKAQERSESLTSDTASNGDVVRKDAGLKVESIDDGKSQDDHKTDNSKKVQDQLDEAQGLLKTAKSTGQSKEARLARVCAGLSSRLQEYKAENAQLEELLSAERELSKSCEARIKELQKDLSECKREVSRVESNMSEALAAKNAEIETLVGSMDAVKRQAALSEGNLASLQASMESMMRSRELTETRMMQALREELASAERRAEEERAAHNATKMSAMEREVELEHRAVEASTALARIQRIADERTAKATELEQKVALLEVECASLNQELQDMEARVRREQKKSPEETNQVIQIQAWQEEVERARQSQRDAENKLSSLEAELQKMRVEMAAMKRDAEHYSRQEHMELEKRYRELTDLLYYKQTQLETMASEKAATEFQLEKEIKRLQEAQVEAERSRVSRRASSSWEEETEIKSLEPLPLYHRHLIGASAQLQKAVKLLDSGAVRATRFLWRYPTARVFLFFYLVFVHLFLMYLMHRLQEQADELATREVAASMGLANPTLP
ncbi:golgin candidate 1 [Neltuma alba]|uniref:golgin candidate 1 n=1 Tax=Neltuma alba TaxID=207710 RepID=UPI0010A2DE3C|nr:golgin candidate 1-like [Prosopis alba]